jgi:proteasome beta subunit
MTLVIALSCSDGVVMASDSQTTETYADVRHSIQKLFKLTGHAIWGGAGDQQTVLDIDEALGEARDTIAGAVNRSQALVDTIKPVLERRYNNVVKAPGRRRAIPWTDSLACGYDPENGNRWIVEVDRDCNATSHTRRGFHAIGAAAGLAMLGNALLAHFHPAEKPLYYGKLLAYRVVDAAIQTSGYGVAEPIQMSTVDASGIHQVDDDELKELKSAVGGWKEDERSLLDRLVGVPLLAPAPPPPDSGTDAGLRSRNLGSTVVRNRRHP